VLSALLPKGLLLTEHPAHVLSLILLSCHQLHLHQFLLL
jgi:hypothetical protein